jgi:protein-S-isoprenylcysteine O-methyltransferase Ste14
MLLGKVAFLVALILQIIIRYPYRQGMKRDNQDRQEQLLLLLLTIGGGLLPFAYIFTNWLAFADYDAPLWLVILGIIVMAVALWLFWRAHADLGSNWSSSLDIHESHELITRGVYQYVRHPMYSASWLIYLAQALLLSNWLAGFGGIVAFALLYFLRVPKEEQMMLQEFGEQYQQYVFKTGRIIPKRNPTST